MRSHFKGLLIYFLFYTLLFNKALQASDENFSELQNLIATYVAQLPTIEDRSMELPAYLVKYHPKQEIEDYEKFAKRVEFLVEKASDEFKILIPAFPCKSKNLEKKVISQAPDVGELLALATLDHLAFDIEKLINRKVVIYLLNDALILPQELAVDEIYVKSYREKIANLVQDFFPDRFVLTDLYELLTLMDKKEQSKEDFLQSFEFLAGKSTLHLEDDIRVGTVDQELDCTYYKQLFQTKAKGLSLSSTERRMLAKQIAEGIETRSSVFANFLKEVESQFLRLSIIDRPFAEEKLSINLLYGQGRKTPWHYAPVLDQEKKCRLEKRRDCSKFNFYEFPYRFKLACYMCENH